MDTVDIAMSKALAVMLIDPGLSGNIKSSPIASSPTRHRLYADQYGVREETCFYHIFTAYFLFIYLFSILNRFFFYLFFFQFLFFLIFF